MTPLLRAPRAAIPLALLALLWLPSSVTAHASLVESDPPDGGTIETPFTLTARYDEDLGTDRSRIIVRDSAGTEVARGGLNGTDPRLMTVELPALPAGDYEARWTAVTPEDNGVTRGTIEFSVTAPASPSPSPTASPAPSPTASDGPTGAPSPTATAAPTAAPTPSPSPPPPDDTPTTGTADLLIALVLAGVLLAALVAFLWRRRSP